MGKKYNFSAGPAILPASVISESAKAVQNWNDSGLSLIEVSHRGADFVAVMEEAVSLVQEILTLPPGYKVLFLRGAQAVNFL